GLDVAGEVSVEQELAGRVELREVRDLAPADEPVAVRKRLYVALAFGQNRPGPGDLAQQSGRFLLRVQAHHDPARLVVHARGGAVIKDADRPVRQQARVVLPGRG